MKRFALFPVFLFAARVACSGEMMERQVTQSLVIDPLLTAYLEEGCHIKSTIALEDGKPGISGGFQVLTREGEIVVEGTFSNGRFEGDLKVYSKGQIVVLERHRNGKPTGDFIEWDVSGRLTHITHYDNDGRKTGTEVRYNHGVVTIEIDWEKGQPLESRRFENGEIVERVSGKELLDLLRAKAIKESMNRGEDKASGESDPKTPSK